MWTLSLSKNIYQTPAQFQVCARHPGNSRAKDQQGPYPQGAYILGEKMPNPLNNETTNLPQTEITVDAKEGEPWLTVGLSSEEVATQLTA